MSRLGPHHFAYLRAVAEGLDLTDSARRYLGTQHGHKARATHQEAVDAVRAVARHKGDLAWRLVGLRIQSLTDAPRPALDDFVAAQGLEGFSESEVVQLYAEAFPSDRKTMRRQRLWERQLMLLCHLESLVAETPQASDLVAGWFEDALAAKLVTAGFLTLGALNTRISAGGRWFSPLPAVGVAKARRIERHLATLLPHEAQSPKALFTLSATAVLWGAPLPVNASSARADAQDRVFEADLDAVLGHYNQVLDVSRDDLKALLARTRLRAYDRKLAEVRCADIMSRDLVTVEFGTPLQEAWALLRERRIEALPVVDRTFRIAGIVTSTDG